MTLDEADKAKGVTEKALANAGEEKNVSHSERVEEVK